MKKLLFLCVLLTPYLLFSQGFSEGFDKVQTIAWINKNIKTTANNYNLSSLQTKCTFTENFYDKNSSAVYKFDLANINVSIVGKAVRLSCKTGDCIEYSFKTPTGTETKKIKYLDLTASESVNDLYKAFLTLKKRVGL